MKADTRISEAGLILATLYQISLRIVSQKAPFLAWLRFSRDRHYRLNGELIKGLIPSILVFDGGRSKIGQWRQRFTLDVPFNRCGRLLKIGCVLILNLF
jgi:hypothetical protein